MAAQLCVRSADEDERAGGTRHPASAHPRTSRAVADTPTTKVGSGGYNTTGTTNRRSSTMGHSNAITYKLEGHLQSVTPSHTTIW